MNARPSPGLIRSGGTVLLLAAACALLPAPARASCGDYVTMGKVAHAQPAPPAAERPLLPAAPCSCTGPMCSGAPVSLPPAPAAPLPVPGKDSVALVAMTPPTDPLPTGTIATDERTRPLRYALPIFHPPR